MRKTTESTYDPLQRILITTPELQNLLGCGRSSATRIGIEAKARVPVGSRVFWNRKRVEDYLA